jgi:hypothetical protein
MRQSLNGPAVCNMVFRTEPPEDEYTFAKCCEVVKKWSPAEFHSRVADAKLHSKHKTATLFEQSLLIMHVELKQYVDLRHRASNMLLPLNDPKHFDIPGDFIDGVMNLAGVHFNHVTQRLESVTLKSWLQSSLCREKMAIFLGTERTGKSELQHAIGRHMCRRSFSNGIVEKSTYYYSSALDPLGVLSREGALDTCSSIHLKDSDLVVLMNSTLTKEELKDVVCTKEAASHRARYFPAVWPARAVRTASWNTGKTFEGEVDWGYCLRSVGLSMLQPMLDDAVEECTSKILQRSSDDKAIISRVVIFKVTEKLYVPKVSEQSQAAAAAEVEEELEAEQLYLSLQKKQLGD